MQSELSGQLYCSYSVFSISVISEMSLCQVLLKKSFLRWGEGEGTQLTSLEAVLLSWFWDMGLKMLKRSTVAKLQTVCLELSTLYNPFVLN